MTEFNKILIANRGEIAIRIMRAANEMGKKTVAVFAEEDKLGLHRFKADEAYRIGEGLGPPLATKHPRAVSLWKLVFRSFPPPKFWVTTWPQSKKKRQKLAIP